MQYCEKRAWLCLFRQAMLFIAGFMLIFGAAQAEAAGFAERAGSMSEITAVRVSNSADKTRIVLDGTKEASYKVSVLSNPQRIVVDIQNAWISPNLKKSTTIDSRFAKSVRIAQHDTSTVRVVVESSMGKNNYKVFPLKGGSTAYRIVMDFGNPIQVSIGQFYGIEINDFAVTVAKTALWIAESQMMKETEDVVHMHLDFLPLKSYANIVEGNALRLDWEDVVAKDELDYIMGNPPFVARAGRTSAKDTSSKAMLDKEQKLDRLNVFGEDLGNV
ncbi:MAG: AMIN domain-containing protein, partial [Selenomonadaceae bacterium]|nr:AMIN domain-containing protein [Selenomonadaceae bacterium]